MLDARGARAAWAPGHRRFLPRASAHALTRPAHAPAALRGHPRRRKPHGLADVRRSPRGTRTGEVTRIHGRHHLDSRAWHRRQQRHLQPGQRGAAAAARLSGARAADDDPRGHPGVEGAALWRVSRRLFRSRSVPRLVHRPGCLSDPLGGAVGLRQSRNHRRGANIRRGVWLARGRRRRGTDVPGGGRSLGAIRRRDQRRPAPPSIRWRRLPSASASCSTAGRTPSSA